jgi:hypothetical protein
MVSTIELNVATVDAKVVSELRNNDLCSGFLTGKVVLYIQRGRGFSRSYTTILLYLVGQSQGDYCLSIYIPSANGSQRFHPKTRTSLKGTQREHVGLRYLDV